MTDTAALAHITAKTQTTMEEFTLLAVARDLISHSKLMHWLQSEFELEHGHATMISHLILPDVVETHQINQKFAKQFKGHKADWLPAFDEIVAKLNHFGPDVKVVPAEDTILLKRNDKLFGLIKVSNQLMTVGINLPGAPFTETFASTYTWTDEVTHAKDISVFQQINDELISWLKAGYARAS